MDSGEQLCLACGLCCDGTLFDLVKLEASDDAAKLKTLGLPVKVSRGKTPVARFPQPCAALSVPNGTVSAAGCGEGSARRQAGRVGAREQSRERCVDGGAEVPVAGVVEASIQ